jgi:hypothetical protein
MLDVIVLETMERMRKFLEWGLEEKKTSPGIQANTEAHNIPNLSQPRSPGVVRTKINDQATYGLRFHSSTYVSC